MSYVDIYHIIFATSIDDENDRNGMWNALGMIIDRLKHKYSFRYYIDVHNSSNRSLSIEYYDDEIDNRKSGVYKSKDVLLFLILVYDKYRTSYIERGPRLCLGHKNSAMFIYKKISDMLDKGECEVL